MQQLWFLTLELEVLGAMTSTGFVSHSTKSEGAVSVWRPWLVGWLGAMPIGVANGIARDALYERTVGPRRAHYISTTALLTLLTAYIALLSRRWPLPTRGVAVLVGAVWSGLAVGF